ncbi:hypothetical protein L6R52_44200, partial [Myxococcota bacterium]|nr:hypothetical protein [Myxococcota bacterium]
NAIRDTTGADGALVAAALEHRGGASGVPADLPTAYASARRAADDAARTRGVYLDRVAATLPTEGEERARGRRVIAEGNLALGRYETQTAELEVRVGGDAARPDAEARLVRANDRLDRAEQGLDAFEAGSAGRTRLAAGLVTGRSEAAEAWADYRPGETRSHLVRAEALARGELTGDVRDAALDRVGLAAVTGLLRHDLRFREVYRAGHHVDGADDALYAQAHRLLDARGGPDASPSAERGRELLGRVDRALDAVPELLEDTAGQMQAGHDVAAARVRSIAMGEITVAQAPVSSVISGPVFAVTWLVDAAFDTGVVDMKEDIAEMTMRNAGMRLDYGEQQLPLLTGGARDLASGFRTARARGEAFDFLAAYRVIGDSELRDLRPGDSTRYTTRMEGWMPTARQGEWQDFMYLAVRGRSPDPYVPDGVTVDVPTDVIASPTARALTGPILGYARAHELMGARDLPVMLAPQVEAVISQGASFQRTRDDVGFLGYAVLGLEVALGVVATGGLGSAGALARGGAAARTAVNTARAIEGASALATMGRAAAHTVA